MRSRFPLVMALGATLLLPAGCGSGAAGVAAPAPQNPPPAAAQAGAGQAGAAQPGAAQPAVAVPSGSAASGQSWDVSALPDPCLTLNQDQVTAATGLSVGAGTTLDSWPPLCSFTLTGPAQEYLYVSADPRPESRADYDRQRTDAKVIEQVPGVGDDAYWVPQLTAMHVMLGTNHVTVKFAGSAPPKGVKALATALAKVALKKK